MRGRSIFFVAVQLLLVFSSSAQNRLGLDPTFGQNGLVIDSFSNGSEKMAVLIGIMPDKTLFVAGSGISRYRADGKPEPSFGVGGSIQLDPIFQWKTAFAMDIIPYTNGSSVCFLSTVDSDYLYKIDAYGSPDLGFGNNGQRAISGRAYGRACEQIDGKIITSTIDQDSISVSRFMPSGSRDLSFGIDGRVSIDNGSNSGTINAIHTDAQRRTTIAGIGYDINQNRTVIVIRLLENGTFDSSFGTAGIALPALATYCRSMVVIDDSMYLALGGLRDETHILKLTTQGKIDSTFGVDGIASVPGLRTNHLIAQASKGLLCVGSNADSFKVARVRWDGSSVDKSFGFNGYSAFRISSTSDDRFNAVAALPDHTFIAAGHSRESNMVPYRTVLAKYLQDAPTSVSPESKLPFVLHPNPATSYLNIESVAVGHPSDVCIYDMSGRCLSQLKLSPLDKAIGIKSLVPGKYFITLTSQTNRYETTFIKL